jgi:chromosome segregation ATPase
MSTTEEVQEFTKNLRQKIIDLETENNQYSEDATTAQRMIDQLNQQKQTLQDKIKLLESKLTSGNDTRES